MRTDPRPTEATIGCYYPASYGSYASPEPITQRWLTASMKRLVELPFYLRYGHVDDQPVPRAGEDRLLDVGCGSGSFLAAMALLGWEPWGIEPNATLARAVASRLVVPEERVFPGTLEDAPYSEESFDLVSMFHVLEHMRDPAGAVSRVHRLLRPGGKIWIVVPNVESTESRIFRHLWRGLEIPRHLYHFSPATLQALLVEAGFRQFEIRPLCDGATMSASLRLAVDAALGRRRQFQDWRILRYGILPVASLSMALGNRPVLTVTATAR